MTDPIDAALSVAMAVVALLAVATAVTWFLWEISSA